MSPLGLEKGGWQMKELALAVLVCLVTVSSGCANKEGNARRKKQGSVSWDSPLLSEIMKITSEWNPPAGTPIKEQYHARLQHLADVLRTLLAKEGLRELAKSCTTMAPDDGNHDWLVRAIVLAAVDLADRETVVAVLSAHFIWSISPDMDIEYYLAAVGKRTDWDLTLEAEFEKLGIRRIKDGITILFDAYSEAKVPKIRRAIAEVVQKAFVHSGVRGEDDASFVANAKQWYEEHKGELELNSAYRWAIKIKQPLFKVVGPSPRTP